MPSVAVPLVPILTVIASSAATELVAVRVKEDPAFSAILDADDVRVMVGADSFSVIVMVSDCEPLSAASAPETPDIAITAVSFPS